MEKLIFVKIYDRSHTILSISIPVINLSLNSKALTKYTNKDKSKESIVELSLPVYFTEDVEYKGFNVKIKSFMIQK